MTLDQLRIFVAVAEREHMTRAAHALNMSQSAASAAIAALEGRHRAPLFDRVGRGLVLSQAGEAFLPEARAVLAAARSAEQALDDLAGLKRGAVSIAASQTVASYWLPARMARFAAGHPGVSLHLSMGNTAQVAEAVDEGRAELGFVEGPIDNSRLARRRVAEDRIALYAAPGHPLVGRSIRPAALRSARWVMREPGSGTRAELEQALAARGVDPGALHVALELPSNEAVLAAVAGGDAVAGVSRLAAEAMVSAGRLAELGFDLGGREFGLLIHRERRQSRASAAFVEAL